MSKKIKNEMFDLNPKCLYYKDHMIMIELQDSWQFFNVVINFNFVLIFLVNLKNY